MAETVVAPNNRLVNFRGKATRERPRTMPMLSKAQNAAMHAAAAGKSTLGIPKSVGQDFVSAQAGKPLKGLPMRVKRREAGGPVDEGKPYMVGESGPELFKPKPMKTNPRRAMQHRGRISNAALNKRLGALERVEAKEHRYGGKDQQGIDASTR
jgi:hypothetical protein